MTGIAIENDPFEQLATATSELRLVILELRETLYATQHHRRTPNDIRLLIEHARLAVHRSQVVRRKHQEHFRIQ